MPRTPTPPFPHPRPTLGGTAAGYVALTFVLSWGGLLAVGGRGFLAGSDWQTDPRFPAAVTAMVLGPPIAGVTCTLLASGMAGLRDLLRRLREWRVEARWYALALLGAPLLQLAVLLPLAQSSPVYLPAIVTSDAKGALLLAGLATGVTGGLLEELGWTGFALPRLRARLGPLAVGLLLGLVWGAWHLLQMIWVARSGSGSAPPVAYIAAFLVSGFAGLTAYRILMVWMYERTRSLPIAVLMHGSYIFTTLFVLAPPTTGMPFIVHSAVSVAAWWGVVAVVGLMRGRAAVPR